jgi:hypothetical protein
MKPLIKQARSFPVTIFMGGRYNKATRVLKNYCDEVGYCVTLKPTLYIYSGGEEHGIEVGLINYPRFPSDAATIINKAREIAEKLRVELKQESYSIQTPDDTIWVSYRKGDMINE